MTRTALRFASSALALAAATIIAPGARAALVVTLDVPQLATAGNALGFEFVSFQFDVYLVGLGDPSGPSDYAANVLANDRENYTYLYRPPCGGGGRGGGYCTHPPPLARAGSYTYSDTYQTVTRPPTEVDAFFHFSGADAVGKPLIFTVQDSGSYTLTLRDAANSAVPLDTPLSSGFYTLEYRTNNILGAQVLIASAVPEPAVALLLVPGVLLLAVRCRSSKAV
jgi:hypothetical protein